MSAIFIWTIALLLIYEKSLNIQIFILQLLQLAVHMYAFMKNKAKGFCLIFPFNLSFAVKRKVTIHSIAHFSSRPKRYKCPSFLARNQQQHTCLTWQIRVSRSTPREKLKLCRYKLKKKQTKNQNPTTFNIASIKNQCLHKDLQNSNQLKPVVFRVLILDFGTCSIIINKT